jgi:hypothetical protein
MSFDSCSGKILRETNRKFEFAIILIEGSFVIFLLM